MITDREIKNSAKLSLQGHWKVCAAVAAVTLYTVPLIAFSAENLTYLFRGWDTLIYGIQSLLAFFLSAAFSLGTARLFIEVIFRRDAEFGTFFSAFENILKATVLSFLMTLFVTLWSLLFVIPGIIAFYRYRMAFYIMAESPGISPMGALKISKKMTEGKKWHLFVFDLSFIGWFILSALTGGLAGLYVMPYYNASLTGLYRELKIEYIDRRACGSAGSQL